MRRGHQARPGIEEQDNEIELRPLPGDERGSSTKNKRPRPTHVGGHAKNTHTLNRIAKKEASNDPPSRRIEPSSLSDGNQRLGRRARRGRLRRAEGQRRRLVRLERRRSQRQRGEP